MSAHQPLFERHIEPELPEGWPSDGFGTVAELMQLLPEPSELSPGAWIVVSPSPPADTSLARFFRRKPRAHLAVRCAALLAKGYEHVGGGKDKRGNELAWGQAPLEPRNR